MGDLLPRKPRGDGARRGAEDRVKIREFLSRYKVPLVGVKILLSFALFAYVVAKVSPGEIWDTIRPADERYLLGAAALFLMSNLIGSWIWAQLLRAQGVPIPYRKAASYYFVGLFFNNFLPSNVGGDITRISDASNAGKEARVPDRKSTRLNSSHRLTSRMPSSA